jgi:hypothetical protein
MRHGCPVRGGSEHHDAGEGQGRLLRIACTTALIDRRVQHAETLSIVGKSDGRHEQVWFPTLLCRRALHVRRLITFVSLRRVFTWSYARQVGTYRALHGG